MTLLRRACWQAVAVAVAVASAAGSVWLGGLTETADAHGDAATSAVVAACRAQVASAASLRATITHVVRPRTKKGRREARTMRAASRHRSKARRSFAEAGLRGEANRRVGAYTAVLLSSTSGNLRAICIMESRMHVHVVGFSEGAGGVHPALSGDQVEEPAWGFTLANNKTPLVDAHGRVGADVIRLSIVLRNGARVPATVKHGWYLAMWSGSAGADPASFLEVSSPRETRDQPLNTPREILRKYT